MKHDDDDFTELIEAVQMEKANLFNSINSNARDESTWSVTGFGCLFVITTDTLELAVIADAVAQGNMRELRNQVISSYKTITRYLFSNKINQNNIRIP